MLDTKFLIITHTAASNINNKESRHTDEKNINSMSDNIKKTLDVRMIQMSTASNTSIECLSKSYRLTCVTETYRKQVNIYTEHISSFKRVLNDFVPQQYPVV